MRKFVLFCLLSILFISANAQGSIKGKIVDSTSRSPMGLATVSVFKAKDTVLVTYRLTTPDGEFKIPGVPFELDCRVVISFSGYRIFRKEFQVNSASPVLDLGTINMDHDARQLDEVLVFAERPPVIIKKDTIEFNASAFRTLPNALVEDLLKKLPGVQVDKDGNIVVNGRPVNRILVDGKTFFGDDPKMATRNLPANVIDKVQVTDDKEEMLRNGDDNMNNVGKVVNITLKKGVKKGWFGKLYAGAGTSKLYEAGAIANIYRDTLQVSVLGYMNNMNRAGFSFSELMQTGGLSRSNGNSNGYSTSIWNSNSGGSGIAINGVSFGGAQNYGGISTSKGIGVNLNHSPNLRRSVFAQYFYGNVLVDRLVKTNTQQFNEDTVVTTNTLLTGGVVTNAHNIGLGARLKPDSLTNIILNANYTIGLSNEDRISDITTVNNKLGALSDGHVLQNNLGSAYYYRHTASLTKLSGKKKNRRFTAFHALDMNNRYNDNTTETALRFQYPFAFDSTAAQLRKERIPRTDANVNFTYTEPVGGGFSLRLSGRVDYNKVNNGVATLLKNGGPDYNVPLDKLSNSFSRVSSRFLLIPAIEYKWKKLTVSPGIRLNQIFAKSTLATLPNSIQRKQFAVLPVLNVVYDRLSINYTEDLTLPQYTNLIPVIDNTNPYFIYKGNPYLDNIDRHNLSLNYQFNNTKRSLNGSVYINGAIADNDIVQSFTVDSKGVQTMEPVNARGSNSAYLNYNVSKQYKNNQKFIFSASTGANYNYNRNKLLYNGEDTWQTTFNLSHWISAGMNINDKVEYNVSFGKGFNFTKYTSDAFRKLKVNMVNWDNEIIVRPIKHIILESQYGVTYNSNTPAGIPKQIIRWNAALNLTMLRNEAGVLKFSVFDILNQNTNVWVNATRNMITSTENNALGQYFMTTFTYNVRPNGVKKKVGGKESLIIF